MRKFTGTRLFHVLTVAVLLPTQVHAQVCEVFEDATLIASQYENQQISPSVAGDGDWAIVGVPGQTGSDPTPGKAFVMQRDGFSEKGKLLWGLPVQITPSTSANGDNFGKSVAMWGDLAVVGAPGGTSIPGAAFIFRNTKGVWIEEAKLVPPDSAANDRFGIAVDIEGDYAVVGKTNPSPGTALVFKNTGEKWELQQTLVPNAGLISQFGRCLSISGERILVGASFKAIFFHFNGTQWQQLPFISAVANSVALQGDVAMIGSSDSVEMVRAFEFQDGSWVHTQTLTPSDGGGDDEFGLAIALHDNILAVGAPWHKPATIQGNSSVNQHGSVYEYKLQNGVWVHRHSLIGSESRAVQSLGNSVALTGDSILAGAREQKWTVPGFAVAYSYAFEPEDCNANGIPDRCDEPDCNANVVVDSCELDAKTVPDCDGNEVPDGCEVRAVYVLDDGTLNTAWGLSFLNPPIPIEWIWMNQFNVLPGSQLISHIDVGWHSYASEGHPVTLALYDDPNNDGHPGDATLLASVNTETHALGIDTQFQFSRVAITSTYVGAVGDSFVVGAFTVLDANSLAFAPLLADMTVPQGRTFLFASASGQADIAFPAKTMTINQNFTNSNAMLRAVSFDCNGNGTWDQCDIDSGFSADANDNGLPDECEGSCTADLAPQKGNGVVDVDDLLFIINNWGACESGEPCEADVAPVGGNGFVDVDDLLFVINNWGPCL